MTIASLKLTYNSRILYSYRDHANGNPELVKRLNDPSVPVYGGDERIPALTNKVQHNYTFNVKKINNKKNNVSCLDLI